MPQSLSHILIKPAGPDCPMACEYCFYLEKQSLFPGARHRMDEATLEALIRQAMTESGDHITFAWQGGEPTLMGLPFFQKAVEYMQRFGHGQHTGNGIQTNGVLLDKEWAAFFRRYNFLVGLSLDGPAHVHDRYRRMKNGDATWQTVHDRARMLMDEGVEVNALSVVNDYSVHHGVESYNFLKETGFRWMQFIPVVEPSPDGRGAASFSVDPVDYGHFLISLFDEWRKDFHNDEPTVSIRLFDAFLSRYIGHEALECELMNQCGVYLVVEHDGSIYPCDFFVEEKWRLGSIQEDSLTEILNSATQQRFGRMKSALPAECQECPWRWICRGGCTKDRIKDPRDEGSFHFCESYKLFFAYADPIFRDMAERLARPAPPVTEKIGRNDPCPCGSGKKFKQCCGRDQ